MRQKRIKNKVSMVTTDGCFIINIVSDFTMAIDEIQGFILIFSAQNSIMYIIMQLLPKMYLMLSYWCTWK